LGLHRLAGLADLAGVRHPALVDEGPGDGEGRAHLVREPLELLEVLLLADAATDGQEEVRGRDVDIAARRDLLEIAVPRTGAGDRDLELGLDRGAIALGGRPGSRPDHEERAFVAWKLDLGVHLRPVER